MAIGIEFRSDSSNAQKDLQKLQQSVGNIEKQASAINSTFKKLGATIASTLSVAAGFALFKNVSDEMTRMGNRVRLVDNNLKAVADTQRELFSIAKQTRTSLSSVVDVYGRMGVALKNTGRSTSEYLSVTRLVQQSVTISDASLQSAEAALVQFGQGLASGTLRGQELNSVIEQIPRLAQAIADGMNIPFGQLRKDAEAGLITTETIFKALETQTAALNDEFERMSPNISQGFSAIGLVFKETFQGITEVTGGGGGLGKALIDISKSLESASASFLDVLPDRLMALSGAWSNVLLVAKPFGAVIVELVKLLGTLAPRTVVVVDILTLLKLNVLQLVNVLSLAVFSVKDFFVTIGELHFVNKLFNFNPVRDALYDISQIDFTDTANLPYAIAGGLNQLAKSIASVREGTFWVQALRSAYFSLKIEIITLLQTFTILDESFLNFYISLGRIKVVGRAFASVQGVFDRLVAKLIYTAKISEELFTYLVTSASAQILSLFNALSPLERVFKRLDDIIGHNSLFSANITTGLVSDLGSLQKSLSGTLSLFMKDALDLKVATTVGEFFTDFIKEIGAGVRKTIKSTFAGDTFADSLMDGLASAVGGGLSYFNSTISAVFDTSTLGEVVDNVEQFANKVVGWFKWVYIEVVGNSWWPDTVIGVTEWASLLWHNLVDILSGIPSFFKRLFELEAPDIAFLSEFGSKLNNTLAKIDIGGTLVNIKESLVDFTTSSVQELGHIAKVIMINVLSIAGVALVNYLDEVKGFLPSLLNATFGAPIIRLASRSVSLYAQTFLSSVSGQLIGGIIGEALGTLIVEITRNLPSYAVALAQSFTSFLSAFLSHIPLVGMLTDFIFGTLSALRLDTFAGAIALFASASFLTPFVDKKGAIGKFINGINRVVAAFRHMWTASSLSSTELAALRTQYRGAADDAARAAIGADKAQKAMLKAASGSKVYGKALSTAASLSRRQLAGLAATLAGVSGLLSGFFDSELLGTIATLGGIGALVFDSDQLAKFGEASKAILRNIGVDADKIGDRLKRVLRISPDGIFSRATGKGIVDSITAIGKKASDKLLIMLKSTSIGWVSLMSSAMNSIFPLAAGHASKLASHLLTITKGSFGLLGRFIFGRAGLAALIGFTALFFSDFARAADGAGESIAAFWEILASPQGILGLTAGIAAAVKPLTALYERIGRSRAARASGAAAGALAGAGEGIGDSVVGSIAKSKLWSRVGDAFARSIDAVKGLGAALLNSSLFSTIGNFSSKLLEPFKRLPGVISKGISTALPTISNSFSSIGSTVANFIGGAVGALLPKLTGGFTKMFNRIKVEIALMGVAMQLAMSNAFAGALARVGGLLATAGAIAAGIFSGLLVGLGVGLVSILLFGFLGEDGFVDNLRRVWAEISYWFRRLFNLQEEAANETEKVFGGIIEKANKELDNTDFTVKVDFDSQLQSISYDNLTDKERAKIERYLSSYNDRLSDLRKASDADADVSPIVRDLKTRETLITKFLERLEHRSALNAETMRENLDGLFKIDESEFSALDELELSLTDNASIFEKIGKRLERVKLNTMAIWSDKTELAAINERLAQIKKGEEEIQAAYQSAYDSISSMQSNGLLDTSNIQQLFSQGDAIDAFTDIQNAKLSKRFEEAISKYQETEQEYEYLFKTAQTDPTVNLQEALIKAKSREVELASIMQELIEQRVLRRAQAQRLDGDISDILALKATIEKDLEIELPFSESDALRATDSSLSAMKALLEGIIELSEQRELLWFEGDIAQNDKEMAALVEKYKQRYKTSVDDIVKGLRTASDEAFQSAGVDISREFLDGVSHDVLVRTKGMAEGIQTALQNQLAGNFTVPAVFEMSEQDKAKFEGDAQKFAEFIKQKRSEILKELYDANKSYSGKITIFELAGIDLDTAVNILDKDDFNKASELARKIVDEQLKTVNTYEEAVAQKSNIKSYTDEYDALLSSYKNLSQLADEISQQGFSIGEVDMGAFSPDQLIEIRQLLGQLRSNAKALEDVNLGDIETNAIIVDNSAAKAELQELVDSVANAKKRLASINDNLGVNLSPTVFTDISKASQNTLFDLATQVRNAFKAVDDNAGLLSSALQIEAENVKKAKDIIVENLDFSGQVALIGEVFNLTAEDLSKASDKQRAKLALQALAHQRSIDAINKSTSGVNKFGETLESLSMTARREAENLKANSGQISAALNSALGGINISIDTKKLDYLGKDISASALNYARALEDSRNAVLTSDLSDAQRSASLAAIDARQMEFERELALATQHPNAAAEEAGKSFAERVTSSFDSGLRSFLKGERGSFTDVAKEWAMGFNNAIMDSVLDGLFSNFMGDFQAQMADLGASLFDTGKDAGGIEEELVPARTERYYTESLAALNAIPGAIAAASGMPVEATVEAADAATSTPSGLSTVGITDAGKEDLSDVSDTIDSGTIDTTKGLGDVANAADKTTKALDKGFGTLIKENMLGFSLIASGLITASGGSDVDKALGIAQAAIGAFSIYNSYAQGGKITGPGTSTSDSIIAAVSNGEFVVNAKATAKHFRLLQLINDGADLGEIPRFATGGLVGSNFMSGHQQFERMQSRKKPGMSQKLNQVFNINVTGDISRQTRNEIQGMIPLIAAGVNAQNRENGNA